MAAAGLGVVAAVASVALLIGSVFAAQQARSKEQLQHEEDQTKAALAEATLQRQLADRYRAELTFNNGVALCDAGDAGRGILWMARGLALCPDSAPELRRRIRTALPSAAAAIHTLEAVIPYPSPTTAVAFSPDGKWLLFGGKKSFMIATASGRPPDNRDVPGRSVSAAAFDPAGKRFAVGSLTGVVRICDVATREYTGPAISQSGAVKSVAFSPDGKTLLVAAQSGLSLQCYDAATRRPVGPTFARRETLLAVGASTAGLLASAAGQGCTLAAAALFPGRTYKEDLYAAVYSPDGRLVATAAKENNASLWDAATGLRVGEPLPHPGVVFTAAFSPDGKTLATGCLDGGVRFWDVESGKPVGPVLRHKGPVRSVVYSRDGRLLLTSSEDGTARLWEAATGRPLGQVLSHPSELRNAVFGPDQDHVLTAGFDGAARLWRLAREESLSRVLPQTGSVGAVAFSPDGAAS